MDQNFEVFYFEFFVLDLNMELEFPFLNLSL